MSYAPADYDFGDSSNYAFAETITCANDEARKNVRRSLWSHAELQP